MSELSKFFGENKKTVEFKISEETSLEEIRRQIESSKNEGIILKLNPKIGKNKTIKICDLFRELHYKNINAIIIAPNTRFIRNLYEGYGLTISERDTVVIKNFR